MVKKIGMASTGVRATFYGKVSIMLV